MLEYADPFLVGGLLFFMSLVAGTLADKFKIPALILFLAIGMMAGVDGPGGLQFNDAEVANTVGTVALAFILFSGGFQTGWKDIKPVLKQGITLSTMGVFLTAIVMAGLIGLLTPFSFKDAFLLGAIISSTDAAAVFSILRTQKVGVKGTLKPLIELESGSNDPMAVFMTITAMNWVSNGPAGGGLQKQAVLFIVQMLVGGAIGYLMGRCACILIQALKVVNEALYPVWGISVVLITFGLTESLYGNGYLAVYICGIVMNNHEFLYKYSLQRFHDGFAWLMQITMFLVLGLLVNPTDLMQGSVILVGMLIAAALMLVARPVAVFLCTILSHYNLREKLFVSWTGLRGAVPIILATYPMKTSHPQANFMFNVVFFVVLTSVLLQGKTLSLAAKLLKLDQRMRVTPSYPLSFDRTPGGGSEETREVDLGPDAAAVGRRVSELNFPEGVTILLVHRGERFLIPKGGTLLEADDTLLLFGERARLDDVERNLTKRPETPEA